MNLYQQLKPNQNFQKIQIKKSKYKKAKQLQSKASNLNDKKESCQKVTTDNCTQTCDNPTDTKNVEFLDCDTTKDCNNNNNNDNPNKENIMNEILQQSETNNNCDNGLCNSVSPQESNNPSLNINNLEVDNN